VKISHYINKARTLRSRDVAPWIINGIRERLGFFYDHVRRVGEPYAVRRMYRKELIKHYAGIDNLVSCCQKNIRERFFISSKLQDECISAFCKEFETSFIHQITADADDICRHTFDLLGSGPQHLGESIDWCRDISSGRKWPLLHYTHCPIIFNDGSDIIRVWELSRFQWGPTLGKAFWLTKDIKYATEFVRQVESWIRSNSYEFGPNWMSSQDVALRAINWIITLCFFNESALITRDRWIEIMLSLYLHGIYIERNLHFECTGKIKTTGTHYLSCLLALLYLGFLFYETPKGKRWLEFGKNGLFVEIMDQVNSDGGDYESSIAGYHRFAMEHFIAAWILFALNRIPYPPQTCVRLEKMFEFVLGYTRPDGKAPQIGDTSDGRVFILSNYSKWEKDNHRYLLQVGSILFGRKDMYIRDKVLAEEAFWLLKRLNANHIPPFPSSTMKELHADESIAFPETGFYFMKNDNAYTSISANPVGKRGKGNHKHNDIFSIELVFGEEPFLVDPGSYVYTADKKARNMFRSTRYHNTLMIDNQELNIFNTENLFQMTENAKPLVRRWEASDEHDYFEGIHHGYMRLNRPLIHERKIFFDKVRMLWFIQDFVYTPKSQLFEKNKTKKRNSSHHNHEVELNFHFAQGMKVKHGYEQLSPLAYHNYSVQEYFKTSIFSVDRACNTIRAQSLGGRDLIIQFVSIPKGTNLTICDGWLSPSYGMKSKAPIITLHGYSTVPMKLLYVLFFNQGDFPCVE